MELNFLLAWVSLLALSGSLKSRFLKMIANKRQSFRFFHSVVFIISHVGELWHLWSLPPTQQRVRERRGRVEWVRARVHIGNSWHALLNLCKTHSQCNELESENFLTILSVCISSGLHVCVSNPGSLCHHLNRKHWLGCGFNNTAQRH